MQHAKPVLWSDFDGTAVQSAPALSPRNWAKYPLSMTVGYAEFLRAVRTNGVDIGGVVTRRPNILVRRLATYGSIRRNRLQEFFESKEHMVHVGSEQAKAVFVVQQSRHRSVGMLEDRPHRLGIALVKELLAQTEATHEQLHPILLGVVSHKRSSEYKDLLVEKLSKYSNLTIRRSETTVTISSRGFSLHIVSLSQFSSAAGKDFAGALVAAHHDPDNNKRLNT